MEVIYQVLGDNWSIAVTATTGTVHSPCIWVAEYSYKSYSRIYGYKDLGEAAEW